MFESYAAPPPSPGDWPALNFTFYATVDSDSIMSYMPDVPYMLPASSWARKKMRSPKLPSHVTHTAADCGGYVATKVWGDYRYSPREYVDWLETFGPRWAATMDYCCEPDLPVVTRDRQKRTTEMAYRFWEDYADAPWVWVPTIQGWEVRDYIHHARELRPLITEMAAHYGDGFRVGIGTLCRRADNDTIRMVVKAVAWELPGIPLHLWGVKQRALTTALTQRVASVDSAAWKGMLGYHLSEWKRPGMTQRSYSYLVALPRYLQALDDRLSGGPGRAQDGWFKVAPES